MKKHVIPFLLILLFPLGIKSQQNENAPAANTTPHNVINKNNSGGVLSGTGTEEDPYLVSDYADLKAVGTSYGLDKVYRLTADIDASASATENSDSGFVPIGSVETPFAGVFHGGGHVIRNLTINRPSTSHVGLFGCLSGLIDSVGLLAASITADGFAGSLVGANNSGTVNECYAEGTVIGINGYSGCLLGTNFSGTVSGCHAAGSMTSSGNYIGGLIGYNYQSMVTRSFTTVDVSTTSSLAIGGLIGLNINNSIVNECYAIGSVTGVTGVGGLIGYNNDTSIVNKSYATGAISGSGNYVGGLIGSNYGKSMVSKSYATGSVSGNNSTGGLVGSSNNNCMVIDCYATGPVSGNYYVGDLVGYNYSSTVSRSYSIGSVIGSASMAGGLIGVSYSTASVISESYWNKETSGITVGVGTNIGTGTVTGLTTDQMRQAASFSGWSFDSTWTIHADSSYPGIRGIDNAPFAIPDSIVSANRTFELSRLLLNDCDIESLNNNLIFHLISITAGVTDSINTLTFPGSIANGTVDTIKYRVGEIRSADTLWGNIAEDIVNLIIGSGTTEDPYIIAYYSDLKSVGTIFGLDKVYRLIADIDASVSAPEHSDSGFVPIGASTSPFTGVFHGGGHVIKNLTIRHPGLDNVGMFGRSNGTIDSLGLSGCSITGASYVGALVGFNSGGTLIRDYASGSVTGNGYYVGGLVGQNDGAIRESYTSVSVTDFGLHVGGLVGSNSNIVSDCYATGIVKEGDNDGYYYGGGLIGYNNGTVSNCFASGALTGSVNVGGLIGGNLGGGLVNLSRWDTETSGQSNGICHNEATATIIGLTTAQMKDSSNFSGWNFDTVWTICPGSTYPGLRKTDNAPFAFADIIASGRTLELTQLLLNDYDLETAGSNLTLRVTGASIGITDSINILSFPYNIADGTVATISYLVGEKRGVDTLWGNIATATITLDTTIITGVASDPGLSVPKIFSLSQNYPNPFNPSTKISFGIPIKSFVLLKIFNVIGREVASLVSEELLPGNYTRQWNAASMPSGVYFYRLQTGSKTETKKLLLLK